ncbi:MAG: putative metal-dependent hydrolase [Reichenbachiella sp.]
MSDEELEELKFPQGKFKKPELIDEETIKVWINTIQSFPEKVSTVTQGLSEAQLDWKYRPGGWSIRQLIHHCADSHMNSFIRFKLTLTEDLPTIRPYFEDRWAEMSDYLGMSIKPSLLVLEGLHERWSKLMLDLNQSDLIKEFVHPEHGHKVSLTTNIALYNWHCKHHLAHIHQAIQSQGKYN